MTRVMLDTNVLASGIAGATAAASAPGELFRLWRRQVFQLVVSEHILEELERTLANRYFSDRLTAPQKTRALRGLRRHAELAAISVIVSGTATHPEDDLVLAAAVSAQVDYLLSGDAQLQRLGRHLGVAIVSPRAFLTMLEARLLPPFADD